MQYRFARIGLIIIGGIVFGALMGLVFGWVVMLLWNWLMPLIFGLKMITFWQAWGLVVLCHLLFKAGPGHHPHYDGEGCGPWRRHFKDKIRQHFVNDDTGKASDTDPSNEND
jgi:hypothetical protein